MSYNIDNARTNSATRREQNPVQTSCRLSNRKLILTGRRAGLRPAGPRSLRLRAGPEQEQEQDICPTLLPKVSGRIRESLVRLVRMLGLGVLRSRMRPGQTVLPGNDSLSPLLRRYNGVIRAAGGRLWLIVDVLSSYGDGRYLRKCESRMEGFRSLAEDNGQAGDLTWGAGTIALVCLGRLFQPLICCRVTKDSRMRPK